MSFNPLKEKGIPLEAQIMSWEKMNVDPYDKHKVHPYTRARVILMAGAEWEGNWFKHQFARPKPAQRAKCCSLGRSPWKK